LPLLRQILPISLPQTKRTNPSRTRWDKKERCWVALADHTWGIIGMKADIEALKDQMASMMEAMLSMKRMMDHTRGTHSKTRVMGEIEEV